MNNGVVSRHRACVRWSVGARGSVITTRSSMRSNALIDGYLAGLGYDELLPAAQKVSGRIDLEIKDLGF